MALWDAPDCFGALRTLIYRLRQLTGQKLIETSVPQGYKLQQR